MFASARRCERRNARDLAAARCGNAGTRAAAQGVPAGNGPGARRARGEAKRRSHPDRRADGRGGVASRAPPGRLPAGQPGRGRARERAHGISCALGRRVLVLRRELRRSRRSHRHAQPPRPPHRGRLGAVRPGHDPRPPNRLPLPGLRRGPTARRAALQRRRLHHRLGRRLGIGRRARTQRLVGRDEDPAAGDAHSRGGQADGLQRLPDPLPPQGGGPVALPPQRAGRRREPLRFAGRDRRHPSGARAGAAAVRGFEAAAQRPCLCQAARRAGKLRHGGLRSAAAGRLLCWARLPLQRGERPRPGGDHQSGLRPGGSGPARPQPLYLRDLFSGEAALLPRRARSVQDPVAGGHQRNLRGRRIPDLLFAPHRARHAHARRP